MATALRTGGRRWPSRWSWAIVPRSFIPVETRDAGTFLAEDGAAREILDRLESRSKDLLTGAWLDGWHRFCEENRSKYTDAIEKNTQLFAHYLDCEAHTDVWRELFPTWRRSEASAE